MKIFGLTITLAQVVPLAKVAAVTEAQKLVASLKGPLGDTIRADIAAMESTSMTGIQKMALVVSRTVPLVAAELGAGTLASDAEDLARELAQSIFNDGRAALKALATKLLG